MGDRTTQATTSTMSATNTTTNTPPSKRRPRVLYGSSVTNSGNPVNKSGANAAIAIGDGVNRSPWNIGLEFYDQRDSFTTTSSIDHDGYGIGPSVHPEEGSYAPQHQRGRSNWSSSTKKPTWMLIHEHSRNQHHNHPEAQDHDEHGIWNRIKDALHLDEHERGHHNQKQAEERTARQILIDVETALAKREDLDASDIEVSVTKPHEVTLEGTVVDRHSKRIAEEVCEGIQGVRDVHNRLKIRDNDPTDANVAFVLPLTLLGT